MAIIATRKVEAGVRGLSISVFTIPTEAPESDGTFAWSSTTIVTVEARAGDEVGLGYTYGDASTGALIESLLAPAVEGLEALDVRQAWLAMTRALRNAGRPGLGFMAVAAVDSALWDLKARLLGAALVTLLDAAHEELPVYASGGFTSYGPERLREHLQTWVAEGVEGVKIKVSRHPDEDADRLDAAREAVGAETELMVDANGALSRKSALAWAHRLRSEWGVAWFEEPVSCDDLEGLRLLRDAGPPGLEIAAGEYGYTIFDFRRLLDAGAVDCLQADVTRCGGITGLLEVGGLCAAHAIDLSSHTAPALSAHAFAAVRRLRHLEYFYDHARVESLLFEGVPEQRGGRVVLDRSRPGNGLALRRADVERFAV